jgi:GWxTD domain-containing protein
MARLGRVTWAAALSACLGMTVSSCGSSPSRAAGRPVGPEQLVPRLFDAQAIYQSLGMIAASEPLPFVASYRFLAGPTGDSTLVLVGISIANRALAFHRRNDVHEARYRVEVTLRRGDRVLGQQTRDETVRVATFQETQRADESVVFEQFLPVLPGSVRLGVAVRDWYGATYSRAEVVIDVPRFGTAPRLSSLIPVYEATPRTARDATPSLIVNPGATVPYGSDTLRLYLEGYYLPGGEVVSLCAYQFGADPDRALWRDSVVAVGRSAVEGWVVPVQPDRLPMGEIVLEARVAGDTARTPAVLSFSSQWVVANLDQMLSLLRYFGHDDAIATLRAAPAGERPVLWREFWSATDPNPRTPEHEALEAYFQRLREADERFREGSDPGWLTDRGEVYITLGQPDDVVDPGADLQDRTAGHVIRWTYATQRIVLEFVDEAGFGRYRLTSASRADYLLALHHLRQGD